MKETNIVLAGMKIMIKVKVVFHQKTLTAVVSVIIISKIINKHNHLYKLTPWITTWSESSYL